jgi:tryptophan halogenase
VLKQTITTNIMSVNKITVLGGGTAGLVSALVLKARFEKLNIEIVKSDNIGIIGVGEGSTEHWKDFMEFIGVPLKELLLETDATFKYGIMFEDWTKEPYFHNITNELHKVALGQYYAGYAYATINKLKPDEYTSGHCFNNEVLPDYIPSQFHFNTHKLNTFLLKKCKDFGIEVHTDDITDVETDNRGIKRIRGDKGWYESDFYIDCTGFKKYLISKLGAKWVSYKDYLPMNEAIAFPTPDTDEYTPYTLAKAMSSGWMWRIPTYGRWGNGYVFDNRYINAEQAQKECEDYLGFKVNVAKNIKFDAGALDRPWIGNCVAMGLCASFIEPLEASSIGTSIQQSFLLMHTLINYKQTDIDQYNTKVGHIVENIRDFVLLHYIVKRNDSKFWKELKVNLPDSLKHNLDKWSDRMPIKEDFKTDYVLFNAQNFAVLLKELELANIDSLKREYDMLVEHNKNIVKKEVELHIKTFKTDPINRQCPIMGHKQYLRELRRGKEPLNQQINYLQNENSNT